MATQSQADAWLAQQTPADQALIKKIAGLSTMRMNANNASSRLGASMATKNFAAAGGQAALDAEMAKLQANPALYQGWQAHGIKTGGLGQGSDILAALAMLAGANAMGFITPQTAATIPGQGASLAGATLGTAPAAQVTTTALPAAGTAGAGGVTALPAGGMVGTGGVTAADMATMGVGGTGAVGAGGAAALPAGGMIGTGGISAADMAMMGVGGGGPVVGAAATTGGLGSIASGINSALGTSLTTADILKGGLTLGAGLIGSATSPNAFAPQAPAKTIPTFTSPFGTATETGFTYAPPADVAAATTAARQQLLGQLNTGITYDPAQAATYQQAYLAARQPALEQQLAQQAQTQQAGLGATGLAGSSGAAYQQALQTQFANQARGQLQNEAILGGQQLAQQDLANKIQAGTFLGGLSQQDFTNAINAMNATAAQRVGSQQTEINRIAQANQAAYNQAAQQNALQQNQLTNAFGAGRTVADLMGLGMPQQTTTAKSGISSFGVQ